MAPNLAASCFLNRRAGLRKELPYKSYQLEKEVFK